MLGESGKNFRECSRNKYSSWRGGEDRMVHRGEYYAFCRCLAEGVSLEGDGG